MNPQTILAWMQLAQTLAAAGVDATHRIKAAMSAVHTDATDAELDAAVQAVVDDATRRKALAESDARGQ